MRQLELCIEYFRKLILEELKKENIICWVAGGILRDFFSNIPLTTDIDVFFPNESEFNKIENYFKSKNCELVYNNENTVRYKYKNRYFDLVKKYFPTPKETINQFDFTVSMFAVDYENVYYGETSFMDLAKKQIIINKITYPESTLFRLLKYYKKGFSICKNDLKTLVDAIKGNKTENNNTPPKNENKEEMVFSNSDAGSPPLFAGID